MLPEIAERVIPGGDDGYDSAGEELDETAFSGIFERGEGDFFGFEGVFGDAGGGLDVAAERDDFAHGAFKLGPAGLVAHDFGDFFVPGEDDLAEFFDKFDAFVQRQCGPGGLCGAGSGDDGEDVVGGGGACWGEFFAGRGSDGAGRGQGSGHGGWGHSHGGLGLIFDASVLPHRYVRVEPEEGADECMIFAVIR